MRKLLIYYMLIIFPFVLILLKQGYLSSTNFVFLLFAYCFICRPIIDYYRIKSKSITINFKEIILNPFYVSKYFKTLYFNK